MEKAFLGANTSSGFINLYGDILKRKKGNRLFILKGGSGTGKSTFLKNIKAYVEEKGYKTNSFYCTSDVGSLDGLLIEKLNVALVDGTAPHVIDTTAYGMFDKIINLGDAVISSSDKLDEVGTLIDEKSSCYKSAYAHISSAGVLYEDIKRNYKSVINNKKLDEVVNDISNYFCINGKEKGEKKEMYISAFTGSGYKDFSDELVLNKKVIFLQNGFDSVASEILNKVQENLLKSGYNIISFRNLFEKDKPIAIEVIDKEIVILSSSFLNKKEFNADITINLDNVVFNDKLNRAVVVSEVKSIKRLLTNAFLNMEEALKKHLLIEKHYYSKVDFNVVDNKLEEFKKELDSLIEKDKSVFN